VRPDAITHGAVKSEEEHRHDICTVGRWMHQHGHVAATDGNASVRLTSDRILTSPTCMSKGMMAPEDLVITDLEGRVVQGGRNPSSELAMHLLIYRLRPDVNAVCHAHPIVATGYAAAGIALDKPLLCELVIGLGTVPVARYGTPGTPELTESLEPLIPGHDAILMANHGVVTYGPDLLTAFLRMETTEHFARVSLVTELLGKQNLLSHRDVEKLAVARTAYVAGGEQSPASAARRGSAENDSAEEQVASPVDPNGRITLSPAELEALIDQAIQRDRSRR
jgi:L-fuculose-phosphate aldolase